VQVIYLCLIEKYFKWMLHFNELRLVCHVNILLFDELFERNLIKFD
jgi:hypothetical protein